MPRRRSSGFTLLEMIVVLAIIGLIMGLVAPRMFAQADKAKVQTAETQIKMLKGAIETMRLDIGRYPTTEEGLRILISRPAEEIAGKLWNGPYLEEALPSDPWGRPYLYSREASDSQAFSLYSFGADGQPGGEGFDADVGYLPRK